MKRGRRNEGRGSRLAERIRERVANVILYELQDPRMGFITVTKAELSKDLADVKVYYSVFGNEGERSRVSHLLKDATGHIQHEMAKVLETRNVPRLHLVYDESVEAGIRMEQLLNELKKEREARGPDAAQEGADGAEATDPAEDGAGDDGAEDAEPSGDEP